jgi:hypothetical protein
MHSTDAMNYSILLLHCTGGIASRMRARQTSDMGDSQRKRSRN